jgi:hypothetical protein
MASFSLFSWQCQFEFRLPHPFRVSRSVPFFEKTAGSMKLNPGGFEHEIQLSELQSCRKHR